jgi:DNA polymerase-3 subunit epsilon
MDFVAIDFETANWSRASACALGMVKVRGGKVVDTWYSLIQPEPEFNWVAPINQSIHGISKDDLRQAPTFALLWPSASSFIEGLPLIAHNMSFDLSVLKATLASAGLEMIETQMHCSLKLTKAAIPDLAAYKLPYVAEHLGILGLNHHDALSDAETCAEIVVHILDSFQDIDFEALGNSATRRSSKTIAKNGSDEFREEAQKHLESPENFIVGHNFTLTGALELGTREEVVGLLCGLGGNWIDSTNRQTTLLVQGVENPSSFRPGAKHSRKFEKAQVLKAKGQDIEVIDEKQLIEMIPSELVGWLSS